MHRLFLPLYRFFKDRKWLLYTILFLSTALFAWFGMHLRLEEDISKLLPRSSTESELAFSDIALKDKIIIQLTSADGEEPLDTFTLGSYMDEFTEALLDNDPDSKYILGILGSLDASVALGAMDYGISHFPSFIDSSFYADFDALTTPEAIDRQMEEDYKMLEADITGDAIKVVSIDPLNFRSALLARLMPSGEEAAASSYTIEEGHFFCPDKSVALAFLTPAFTQMESGKATKFYHLLEKVRKAFEEEHPDAVVLAHGNPLGSVSNAGTIKRDMLLTVGISMLIILIILLLCFRSWRFILQMVGPILYGTLFSLACLYWIKGYMSLMALGISAIILGVAISYCLHILIHHHFSGDVEKVLREESTPVVLGCLTTVGAFLGLLFTESDLLRDFGLFSTFALIGSTLAALVFLPHFLKEQQPKAGFPLVDRINNFPWDRNKWVLAAMAVIIAAGLAMSGKVKFDSDLRNIDYDEPTLVRSQSLYEEKNNNGNVSFYFATYDNDLDKALEYGKGLFARLDSLKQAGIVKGYSQITPLLFQSTSEQEARIAQWKRYWTPERIATLRRNMETAGRRHNISPGVFSPFLAVLEGDYEPGNLFEAGVVPEDMLSNFIEHEASGRYLVFTDVSYAAEDGDRVTDALVSGEQTIILEPFYYCRDMVEIVHDDFRTTLLISSIFVFLVLLLAFRRFSVAITAFLPMFLSWYILQGLMAIFGLEFNLINIVISTFVFGIGVDYSIFVMEGLLSEARTGEKQLLSWHKTAIFFSALVLIIVVASLIFATHPAIRSIGLITVIGMTSTILLTYCLEPLIFRLLMNIPLVSRVVKGEKR